MPYSCPYSPVDVNVDFFAHALRQLVRVVNRSQFRTILIKREKLVVHLSDRYSLSSHVFCLFILGHPRSELVYTQSQLVMERSIGRVLSWEAQYLEIVAYILCVLRYLLSKHPFLLLKSLTTMSKIYHFTPKSITRKK